MKLLLAVILLAVTSFAQLAITGPAVCQAGQTCNYSGTGGTGPYSFTLLAGSVGSITSGGVYTAPATVTPSQTINGCMAYPSNTIFNTNIASMPVNSKSALWLSNLLYNFLYLSGGQQSAGNAVLSTDTTTPMIFRYTPTQDGNFVFPNLLRWRSETSMSISVQQDPDVDNHSLITYRDTCQQQENYQFYPTGFHAADNPTGNSQSGNIYSLNSLNMPQLGTDAAGYPLAPLMIHQNELAAAAAGNVNAIKHAVRFIESNLGIDHSAPVWPAQNAPGTNGCEGQSLTATTSNTGNTVTLTSGTFLGTGLTPTWPAGTQISLTISGVPTLFTVNTITSPSTLTLTTAPGNGTLVPFTQPNGNCAPYGSIFRVKSSFSFTFDGICTTTACQNIVNAIINAGKNYGFYLADGGTSWDIDIDGSSRNSNDLYSAATEFVDNTQLTPSASMLEAVDVSTLQTNQTYSGTSGTWLEAKLGVSGASPTNAVVVKVTDSTSATALYSVALQGVAIGFTNSTEPIMAGADPVQLTPWVTGSSNTGFTCSLSPSGGAYGSITSGCLYSPAPASSVTARTVTTVTVTAAANSAVTASITLIILPVDPTSKNLYIGLGKIISSDIVDSNGVTWWADMLASTPNLPPLFSTDAYSLYSNNATYTGTITSTAQAIFNNYQMTIGDVHLNVWVPNGTHTVTVYFANPSAGATATGQLGYDMYCNGTQAAFKTDIFTAAGAVDGTAAQSCTVATNYVQVLIRTEFLGTRPYTGLTIQQPCCSVDTAVTNPTSGNAGAIWLAGMVIGAAQNLPPGSITKGVLAHGVIIR